jgi:hypothetical protein
MDADEHRYRKSPFSVILSPIRVYQCSSVVLLKC